MPQNYKKRVDDSATEINKGMAELDSGIKKKRGVSQKAWDSLTTAQRAKVALAEKRRIDAARARGSKAKYE